MEKATLTLRREQQIDMDAAVVALNLPDGFTRGEALEHLEHMRAIIQDHVEPSAELLARLGEYRQIMLHSAAALEPWRGGAFAMDAIPYEIQARLTSMEAAIRLALFAHDDAPDPAAHCLNVRVLIPIEKWEAVAQPLRKLANDYFAQVYKTIVDMSLDKAALGIDDHDLLDGPPVVEDLPTRQSRIHSWFFEITGWPADRGAWSESVVEAAEGYQGAIEEYVNSARRMPDRPTAAAIEDLYREAFSQPFNVPAPFAEAVQSYRHSGRRPQ